AVTIEIENPIHRKAYDELMRLDLDGMTPMQLMLRIHDLKAGIAGTRDPNPSLAAQSIRTS
ncbi:MAG: hypothetical protein M3Y08_13930, partial [Fibrobacterota bacterium]|nr:hypothetical protein [Fibrobacterota bacterium]